MKRLFSLLALIVAFCPSSFATVRTLCNMPYSPGQFTTFLAAQTASADGDTIYVHGSDFSYGSVTISKSLVIIGTGHNPAKQMPLVSMFQNIFVNVSGVQLIGLKFNSLSSSASNGTIKRCRIQNTTGSYAIDFFSSPSNWLIEGNIIETANFDIDFSGGSADNFIIKNNIFTQSSGALIYLNNGPSQRTYFLNNIVLGLFGYDTFYNIRYTTINNNIFISSSLDHSSTLVTNCTMNNNISYQCNDNNFYSPGSNNLVNVDPLFVNYTYGSSPLFNYSNDFHLAPGSPGLNNGTDGTDRGLYGGLGFGFNMTGEPSIAEITAFTITSPTIIAPGGSLTISVTSKRVH